MRPSAQSIVPGASRSALPAASDAVGSDRAGGRERVREPSHPTTAQSALLTRRRRTARRQGNAGDSACPLPRLPDQATGPRSTLADPSGGVKVNGDQTDNSRQTRVPVQGERYPERLEQLTGR